MAEKVSYLSIWIDSNPIINQLLTIYQGVHFNVSTYHLKLVEFVFLL